ncbi:MAG: N-acetylneuraminate synthase family protein, partial [Chthoniobacteraceae bacterium]
THGIGLREHTPSMALAVVDPTHGIGLREHIPSMALAAVAAGADAVMVEVHNSPELAKSDGEQALMPDEFSDLVQRIRKVAEAIGRSA